MPTFYGPPSDETVIPEQLETALAADIGAPGTPIRDALDAAGLGQIPEGQVASEVELSLAAKLLTSATQVEEGQSAEWRDENGKLLFAIDNIGTDSPSLRGSNVGGGSFGAALVVTPSGDTTGAVDTAAINDALQANPCVVAAPGQWYQNGPYVIPSETRLHCEGPFDSFLVAGSNSNLVTNEIAETTCTKVALTGTGHVRFDGNAGQQTRLDGSPDYAGWKNHGIHFVNVDGLFVNGITWANTAMFGALMTGVRNALWLNNRVEQDFSQPNQDGLDIGPGCSFVYIDGLTGNTEDDVHSIFAKYSTSQKTVHPLYLPADAMYAGQPAGALYSPEGNSTHDIHVHRSYVNAGKNFFRLQAAEGSKLYKIYGNDIRHTGSIACRALVIFGEMIDAYIDAPPAADGSDFHTIAFDGFTGHVLSLVYLDSHIKDVHVNNVVLGLWGSIISERDLNDPAPNVRNLHIHNVSSDRADGGNIVTAQTAVLTDVAVTGLDLATANRVLYGTQVGATAPAGVRYEGHVGAFIGGGTRSLFENSSGSGTGWANITTGANSSPVGALPALPAGAATITNEGA